MNNESNPKPKRSLVDVKSKSLEKSKADQERLEKNMALFKVQGEKLAGIIKAREVSITELANELGIQRQTIYNWMDGKTDIPEDKIFDLSEKFKMEPAVIRYDIKSYSENDLEYTLCVALGYFESQEMSYIPKEVKSSIMAKCYTLYMSEISKGTHPEVIKSLIIDEIIRFFDFYKKFGGEVNQSEKKNAE